MRHHFAREWQLIAAAAVVLVLSVGLGVGIAGAGAGAGPAGGGQQEPNPQAGERVEAAAIHVHLVSGSREYESEASLRAWKGSMLETYANVRITASWGQDGGRDLPDLEPLGDADVMVVFLRRNNLPEDQLARIRRFWESGRAVIGIRTASHAFDRQTNAVFDRQVLGGSYSGHGGDEPRIGVELDAVNRDHLVLGGVEPWERAGKLYHNRDNAPGTVTLLTATGRDDSQPVAWVYQRGEEVGGGRSFYTSLGYPHDFENANFQRLLLNAVQWTTGRALQRKE